METTVEGKNQKVVKLVLHPNEKLTTSAYQGIFDVRLTEDSYMNDEVCYVDLSDLEFLKK